MFLPLSIKDKHDHGDDQNHDEDRAKGCHGYYERIGGGGVWKGRSDGCDDGVSKTGFVEERSHCLRNHLKLDWSLPSDDPCDMHSHLRY